MNQNAMLSWANVVVALCAVIGLGLAIRQNVEMRTLLEDAGSAFRAQVVPLVQFSRYQWFVKDAPASCENPAMGLNVYFRNMSGVPVTIQDVDLKVRMGDRTLGAESERHIGHDGESILAPGMDVAIGQQIGDEFAEAFVRMDGTGPGPHLNFTLSVKFSSLVTGKTYCYRGDVEILEHCKFMQQTHFTKKNESQEECGGEGTKPSDVSVASPMN
ncbi:MAG: hypothetical protein FLDDKLPJ_00946 [Phycisphaerae bacterium]|nr:hypothetical protein [Phycisphaerae bacterium]